MKHNGGLSHHFWLTQGMARSIGLNLNTALKTGLLDREEFARMIATCSACGNADRCIAWMAEQGRGAGRPPDCCAIGQRLERLKGPG